MSKELEALKDLLLLSKLSDSGKKGMYALKRADYNAHIIYRALERAKKEQELLELYQLKDNLLGDVAHGRMTIKEADSLIMATKEEIEALLEELK